MSTSISLPAVDWVAVTKGAQTIEPVVRRILSGRRRGALPWTARTVEVDSAVDPVWLAAVTRYIQGLAPGALLTLYAYTTQDFEIIQDFLHGGQRYIETFVVPTAEEMPRASSSVWARDVFARTWTKAGVLERYGLPSADARALRVHYKAAAAIDSDAAADAWDATWTRLLEAARPHFTARFWREARAAYIRDWWQWFAQYAWAARCLKKTDLMDGAPVVASTATPLARFKALFPFVTAAGWRAILEQYVADLDAVFADAPPLPRPLVVFRGTKRRTRHWSRGYVSTSLLRSAAANFVGADGCCMHEMHVPAGARVLPVAMITRYSGEVEVLLPRGLMRS